MLGLINWANVALLFLKLANTFLQWQEQRRHFEEGARMEVLSQAKEVLRRIGISREVLEDIESLVDSDLDRRLRELEPDSGPNVA